MPPDAQGHSQGRASLGHLLQLLWAGHQDALPAVLSTDHWPLRWGPAYSPKAPAVGTRPSGILVPPPFEGPFQGSVCSGPWPLPQCPGTTLSSFGSQEATLFRVTWPPDPLQFPRGREMIQMPIPGPQNANSLISMKQHL